MISLHVFPDMISLHVFPDLIGDPYSNYKSRIFLYI